MPEDSNMLRLICLIGSVLFLMVACDRAETPKNPLSQQQAADTALRVLQKLVTSQNFKAMGFDSENEVEQSRLSTPLPVFNVGLDQIKGYDTSKDPNTLLTASSEIVYPVTVGGRVKSSVTIVHKEQGYQPSSFGNAEIIRRLSEYRREENAGNEFIVRVPALNMYFLGRRAENQVLLVPIIEDPRLKLRPGEPLPAQTVLAELTPIARAYNGLPM
jgi:hypothetical protein